MERRDFLKSAAAGIASTLPIKQVQLSAPTKRPESSSMLYRDLGTTGERVSVIGMGGYHLGKQSDASESIRLIHSGVDRGITFLDNCWDYNDGISEVRMGQALRKGYREKVFLMTKLDGRTAKEYNKQLEESLGRLQTDTIDLVQFHEVIRMEDPDRIFAPGGAIEAAIAAKQAGKVRYLGFTGHKDPAVHLGHEENLLAVAVAQGLAHADFGDAVVVVPAVVHEGDAAVDGGVHETDALSGVGLLAEVITAHADGGDTLSGGAQVAVDHVGHLGTFRWSA